MAQPADGNHLDTNSRLEARYNPCDDHNPSETQQRLIDSAWKNASTRSQGKCARYVKNAIEKIYGIAAPRTFKSSDSGRGVDAYEIITAYKINDPSSGFKRCEFLNPHRAPPGCIVFYDSYARRSAGRSKPAADFPDRNRKGWNLYFGHVEIITNKPSSGSAPYKAVSDFKQEGGPIIAGTDPSDIATGWGVTRNRAREYQVMGIYCKR